MELNLKRVSKIKQELTQEVVGVWLKHTQNENKEAFVQEMGRLGWTGACLHGHGSFKQAIWKNNIVAKFASLDQESYKAEVDREWEQFNTAPAALKKHLPNAYIFKNGLLVQDRVILKCDQVFGCTVNDVARKLNLRDYSHNHGHNLAGTIKFFDWVWRRCDPWLNNIDKPLKEE